MSAARRVSEGRDSVEKMRIILIYYRKNARNPRRLMRGNPAAIHVVFRWCPPARHRSSVLRGF
jgi:hypothetical protein